ncbi:MAG: MATE family efflux transporter, partial [Chromatiales bacterium]
MTKDPYSNRAIWAIALPMIVSSVSVPLVGIVGTGVLGHLDDSVYLASVAAAAQVFSILFVGFNFLRMGTTGITAQAHGSGVHNPNASTAIRQSLGEAIIVALVLGAFVVIVQAPIRNAAFGLIGAEPEVTRYAQQYFDIRVWSAPATLFNYAALGWLLGMQNARGPLAITLVINLSNVALDLWFVLGLGLKVRGVATGALLAELAGAAVAVWLLRQELQKYPGSWAGTRLKDLRSYRALLKINGNLFIRTLALMFTFGFMTVQGARMGSVFLASNALLLNFQWLTSYALDGLANAAEALVGKAVGARNREGMLRAV